MIAFNRPVAVGNEFQNLRKVLGSGRLSGDGEFTKLCSRIIAEKTESQKALLTHSCTAALEMAAILADIGQGDEVIMPSFTFVSTANAVVLRGGVPVFVDIDPVSLNIDPLAAAKAVTSRTRAIFAVHYAGMIAEMEALSAICASHGLMLVEDAAQAFGSAFKGRMAGSFGDLATFSFHETKNIVSGEGGALTINRPDLIERAEIIREKGTNRSLFLRGEVDKYTWVDIGSSLLPGELIAAFLHGQLEHTNAINNRRLALCARYDAAFRPLADSGRLRLPELLPERTGNGHMFYILLRNRSDRDNFIARMQEQGIGTPFHYVPLHSSPAGRRYARYVGTMATTNAVSDSLVRLPLHFGMSDADQDTVIAAALSVLSTTVAHEI